MARQRDTGLFKSKRMRATLVDQAGRPVYGPESVVVTSGQITTSFTSNVEEGEAISQPNGNGDTCLNIPATPTYTGETVEATFCKVDFALFELLTGSPVVRNDDGTIVGIKKNTKIDLSKVNFALELWTGAQVDSTPRAGAEGAWGYFLAPFLQGGTLGDITVENAAITFTVTGMQTKNGNAWGRGPYKVDLVGGVAAPLNEALDFSDHLQIISVEIAPPSDALSGFQALLDPSAPALTDITVTGAGLSKTFAPTPAGTDPVEYDFGNGEWDYAETGSYTYEYPAAGTYTVTARRGSSTVTKSVTVTAP
jgi:hypothetical protein